MQNSLQIAKLTSWRQSKGFSTHALATAIQERMAKDYPDGYPRGVKITQTDVRRAESYASMKSFLKVTEALYSYFDVSPGHFGDYENPSKKYKQEAATHQVMETTITYQANNIISLQKLVDTQAKLIQSLETELAETKRQLAKLQKG